MKVQNRISAVLALTLLVELAFVPATHGALLIGYVNDRARKADNLALVAANVIRRLRQSDQGIPDGAFENATAVAVFPAVYRSRGLFSSGFKGKGVVSRRIGAQAWTAPAFFDIDRKSDSGIPGLPSTIVVILKDNFSVDGLRSKAFNFNEFLGETGVSKQPGVVAEPQTGQDFLFYEYVDGTPVAPSFRGARVRANNEDSDAVYGTKTSGKINSADVLFYKKETVLANVESTQSEDTGVSAFTRAMVTLPKDTDITPRIDEFFDAGFSYTINKTLDQIADHMKRYFTNNKLLFREARTSGEIIITVPVDLPDRARRHRRAAFLIEIIQESGKCAVNFKLHVSSNGVGERDYYILEADKKIPDLNNPNPSPLDESLIAHLKNIDQELRNLRDK